MGRAMARAVDEDKVPDLNHKQRKSGNPESEQERTLVATRRDL